MPSLADSLDNLRQQCEQIAYLSTLNARPAGPFVTAYLHLPTTLHQQQQQRGNVLELIRDASEAERRLFKFVGESDAVGGVGQGGGNKKVEKRDGDVVTPLKDLKKGKAAAVPGRDDTEIMLKTAMKLVDDYRPMPRARAHVINLLDAHHRHLDRLAELEMLIEEASKPVAAPAAQASSPSPSLETPSASPKPKLTPEESFKAEEAALRALEAKVAPLRRAAFASQPPAPAPSLPESPPPRPPQPPAQIFATPARHAESSSRTPGREMPHVTNSLVNNPTPRRIDRFSPLKLIGTPRAPVGSSGLRNEPRSSIFGFGRGLRSTSASNGSSGVEATPGPAETPAPARVAEVPETPTRQEEPEQEDEHAGPGEDETIRIPKPASPPPPAPPVTPPPPVPVTPQRSIDEEVDETPRPSRAEEAEAPKAPIVEGVDLENEDVKAGVAKVWSTLGDVLMRQGLPDGEVVDNDVESSVKHIHLIAQSNLPSPASPGSSASSSLGPAGAPKSVSADTIFIAHIVLILLQAASAPSEKGAVVDMNEMKERLKQVSDRRGWSAVGEPWTKSIYALVGKRTVKIDRKGGRAGVAFV
ncbi:hypothetical protein IAT38_002259 [Cryptococcus sp. DSM 104549]